MDNDLQSFDLSRQSWQITVTIQGLFNLFYFTLQSKSFSNIFVCFNQMDRGDIHDNKAATCQPQDQPAIWFCPQAWLVYRGKRVNHCEELVSVTLEPTISGMSVESNWIQWAAMREWAFINGLFKFLSWILSFTCEPRNKIIFCSLHLYMGLSMNDVKCTPPHSWWISQLRNTSRSIPAWQGINDNTRTRRRRQDDDTKIWQQRPRQHRYPQTPTKINGNPSLLIRWEKPSLGTVGVPLRGCYMPASASWKLAMVDQQRDSNQLTPAPTESLPLWSFGLIPSS